MREADILYRLHHPALTRLFEIFVEDGKHYLVMEYVPGHTLEEELLAAGKPLEWQRVARWGVELCDVLGYLHSQSPAVIYRDLKPPNVMLTPDGPIKLIDFGIARWFHPARTHDTTQLGTDGYAADGAVCRTLRAALRSIRARRLPLPSADGSCAHGRAAAHGRTTARADA